MRCIEDKEYTGLCIVKWFDVPKQVGIAVELDYMLKKIIETLKRYTEIWVCMKPIIIYTKKNFNHAKELE